jgi:hypothetical protein
MQFIFIVRTLFRSNSNFKNQSLRFLYTQGQFIDNNNIREYFYYVNDHGEVSC